MIYLLAISSQTGRAWLSWGRFVSFLVLIISFLQEGLFFFPETSSSFLRNLIVCVAIYTACWIEVCSVEKKFQDLQILSANCSKYGRGALRWLVIQSLWVRVELPVTK